ncbi:uncharacterized protein LOC111376041 [Olea europaea var. sylvestris]|uniref:uncharacterized protein LOC111376041 n=1 Tax=Olea europaea var. sylvestris TaxID=158386 RepID=UPI000C1D4707|nr:uncharacterized protein LOC111376041 [Olea europaea var. sylvestris]XP_022854736.1 uncharacterized protein LOC111376041 [Olea europaea var. sylvestris]
MKIQPVDFNFLTEPPIFEPVKPVTKSRFKRLFERQFSSVLRISTQEKAAGNGGADEPHQCIKYGPEEFEPSSVCLAKMVQNFIEDNEKPNRCCRNRCKCFNKNCTDSSDEELDSFNCFGESTNSPSSDALDLVKSLVPCVCVYERNLLADAAKIVEKNKISKRKDCFCRKIVTDNLIALGYNASICKSRWEKSPSFPSGEYEYVDVMIEGDRFIIDIDFRSEFEIARSTKAYRSLLQTLPNIFVGKSDRLEKIINVVSDAAKQSLKKKGMPFPPWRKADYVKAKWLSPYTRTTPGVIGEEVKDLITTKTSSCGEFELIFLEKCSLNKTNSNGTNNDGNDVFTNSRSENDKGMTPLMKPVEIRPRSLQKGVKMVTGLASVIEDDKP